MKGTVEAVHVAGAFPVSWVEKSRSGPKVRPDSPEPGRMQLPWS